jgi:AraC family transcriptional regulator of adaptative response/methylated-DNA-[protein]-cysteine methyltransferase
MTTYERIEKVIRYVEARRQEQPSLETLARVAGLSPSRFHRLFAKWAGTTPKDFVKYLTSEHAKSLLARSEDLLTASLESGLSGPGRLHDLFVTVDGVTPGEFKQGGEGLTIRFGFSQSPFGEALIGWTERGICAVEFVSGRTEALKRLRQRWPKAALKAGNARAQAKKIFSSSRQPLVVSGTPFQVKVWEALLRIPTGKAVSYGELAKAVGKPKAARAVGSAVGSNSIAYLIPCHRVLRSAGVAGEYRWGASRKKAILAWESAAAAR